MIDFTDWTLKKLWLFWFGVVFVPLDIMLLLANGLRYDKWAHGSFWVQTALLVPLCFFLALLPALKISLKMNAKRWREEEDARKDAEAEELEAGDGDAPEATDDDVSAEEAAATEEVAAEVPAEEPEAAPVAEEPEAGAEPKADG